MFLKNCQIVKLSILDTPNRKAVRAVIRIRWTDTSRIEEQIERMATRRTTRPVEAATPAIEQRTIRVGAVTS